MRECKDYEIRLKDFLNAIHCYTEIVNIEVVGGWNNGKWASDFTLGNDVFGTRENKYGEKGEEYIRLTGKYGDVPVWNISANVAPIDYSGRRYGAVITARCHYADVADIYETEQAERKAAKKREQQKAYRERKKGETRE